ncbi:MAG: hypothetical protein A2138_00715 [Deltaproteobacteria bacterium RBG_16_71_12]|nr:MAG: hypothetical protein A2138_00715 [Deltaproteobacteria bacterium RBG_16_71_12]
MADAALVLRARAGQAPALGELFRRYFGAARAVAWGVTGDALLAEDVAVDALQAAFAKLDDLDDPAAFGPWLRTIARRRASAAHRARRDGRLVDEDAAAAAPCAAPGAADALLAAEARALVRLAVDALPAALREAICLHELEGYPVEQAAGFLEIPVGTLKRRLFDARAALARTLSYRLEGRGPPAPSQRADAALRRAVGALERDPDAVFAGLREALALGRASAPVLEELRARVCDQAALAIASSGARAPFAAWMVRVARFSPRSLDERDPQGRTAAALQRATAAFPLWQVPDEALLRASRLFGGDGLAQPPRTSLPLSWSVQGRAMLLETEDGVADPAGAAQGAGSLAAFCAGLAEVRLVDVVQLLRLDTRPHQLFEVEELVRGIATLLAPGAAATTSSSARPGFSGLELRLDELLVAVGGVSSRAQGELLTVQLFVPCWARVLTGAPLVLEPLPPPPDDVTAALR